MGQQLLWSQCCYGEKCGAFPLIFACKIMLVIEMLDSHYQIRTSYSHPGVCNIKKDASNAITKLHLLRLIQTSFPISRLKAQFRFSDVFYKASIHSNRPRVRNFF